MKYLSLFSGIGGFELGIRQARSDTTYKQVGQCSESQLPSCIGYSETNKYAIQIYERHFNHENYGDITKLDPARLGDFDLLVGGFPCQSFSIAGKRGGFDDTRGTLFFEIARIVKQKQPRLLLLENVKGLLSHNKGETFFTIIATLDELGYDLQWQVLNSKDFGVPQNRERVFIVGHLRGTRRPEVFPFGENDEYNYTRNRETKRWQNSTALTVRNADGYNARGTYISYALDANYYKGISEEDFIKRKKRQLVYTPEVRRLTPTECERLQGFPDGWTEGISDTQRYKCLGNAVTVNVIEAICGRLL